MMILDFKMYVNNIQQFSINIQTLREKNEKKEKSAVELQ